MKPAAVQKRTRTITQEYWWCGVERCLIAHQSEWTALTCIKRPIGDTEQVEVAPGVFRYQYGKDTCARKRPWTDAAKARQMREAGATWREVGEYLGVSGARASQIVTKAIRLGWRLAA